MRAIHNQKCVRIALPSCWANLVKTPSSLRNPTTMYDILRDSTLGYILRHLSHGKIAAHRESLPDFQLCTEHWQRQRNDEQAPCHDDPNPNCDLRPSAHQPIGERGDLERGEKEKERRHGSMASSASGPSCHACLIVSWYSESDPDNPHNWSRLKKGYVSFVILLYTFTVYIGSSMYTASIPDIVDIYQVPQVIGSLGLSLYVLGYGTAPLILSPLSEIPAVGRNIPYIITFSLFVALCIPMVLVDNIPGLLVLRFLLGFCGSPALATGGASYGDFYGAKAMPYVIALWGGGATLGPVCVSFHTGSELGETTIYLHKLCNKRGPCFLVPRCPHKL